MLRFHSIKILWLPLRNKPSIHTHTQSNVSRQDNENLKTVKKLWII